MPDLVVGDCTTTEVDAATATIGTDTEPTAVDGCKVCVYATMMRRGGEELTAADAESCAPTSTSSGADTTTDATIDATTDTKSSGVAVAGAMAATLIVVTAMY